MIKKFFVLFLFCLSVTYSQSPKKFTYQSVIKNSSGYLLKNQDVGLRISVLFNSNNGIAVYSEEHTVESNNNGLVTLIIGDGFSSDVFSDIDWGNGEYFLKVEVDPEGGVNYVMNQTSQLLSVPYALYASNSGSNLNLLGKDYITLNSQTLTIGNVDLTDDVDGILPIANGGTGDKSAPMVQLITALDASGARKILGLSNGDSVTFSSITGDVKTTAADGSTVSTVLNSNVGSDDAAIFTGNVTGNLTGNVTGDITGNAIGDITGDVKTTAANGDVTTVLNSNVGSDSAAIFTGNLTGNVTGDITGNAATVTINKPSSDSDADPTASGYSSTAVIGGGQRTFNNSSGSSQTFQAGINLSGNSIVTVSPVTSATFTSGLEKHNIQLLVTISASNDEFTVTCIWNGLAKTPDANFNFTFIAIK